MPDSHGAEKSLLLFAPARVLTGMDKGDHIIAPYMPIDRAHESLKFKILAGPSGPLLCNQLQLQVQEDGFLSTVKIRPETFNSDKVYSQ